MNESIDLKDFVLQGYVGRGSFGKVYKVKNKKSGELYAAKVSIYEFENLLDDNIFDLKSEINILSKLDHPSILKYLGFSPNDFKKRLRPVIITEYASNGTLEKYIINERNKNNISFFDDTKKLIILYGIASSMSYLHSHDVIHGNLKPRNILFDDFLFPKVSDFGLSNVKFSNFNSMANNSTNELSKENLIYTAPELFNGAVNSKPSDVYSLSIICYELITNEKPFDGFPAFQISFKINQGYRPEFKKPIPKSYQNLITLCWSEKPSLRPTFNEILYLLKNDRGFITEKVDENEYFKFINYIDTHNSSCFINNLSLYSNQKSLSIEEINEYSSVKPNIIAFDDFMKLEEKCRKIIIETGENPDKQFLLGKYFFEGQNQFPRNPMFGITYLNLSMKSGCLKSVIYYCENLIKGDIIKRDIKKAKKILETIIKDKDLGEYYLLNGKISKKEGKFKDCQIYLEKSISYGNNESMHEYGKLLIKGKFSINDKEKGIQYIKKSAENHCKKAMFKYGIELINGINTIKNTFDGIRYILNAAEYDHSKALYFSSILFKINNKLPSNEELSFLYLKRAAYLGYVKAMFEYAIELIDKESAFDDDERMKESILFLKKASDAGHYQSLYFYNHYLELGINVKHDLKKAFEYLKIAAKNGYLEALYNYGNRILNDQNIKDDKIQLKQSFKEASDKSHIESIFNYAGIRNIDDEATKYFKMLIADGDSEPLLQYALILLNENQYNEEEVKKYLKMANDKGNKISLLIYSLLFNDSEDEESFKTDDIVSNFLLFYALNLFNGNEVPVNKEEAIEYFKMAIDKGNSDAMYQYAQILLNEKEITFNKEEAIKYFKMAIDKGNSDAMCQYAQILLNEKEIASNKEEAIKYFKMAIDKGNSDAMCHLAVILYYGDGVPVNKKEAIKYFKMAIDKGNSDAMVHLAVILYYGDGVPVNKDEGIKYFKMAIDKGNSEAMNDYAAILFYGNGIPVNKDEGIKYFKMAIEKDNSKAMFNYAVILERGIGVPINIKESIKYYKMAIDRGNTKAMYNYALMLSNGDKVDKNEAAKYFKMAINKDNLSWFQNMQSALENDDEKEEEDEKVDD